MSMGVTWPRGYALNRDRSRSDASKEWAAALRDHIITMGR